ncbi:MAG TPA: hypothetical protein VGK67_06565 [Myxococcales bacterium]
MVLPVVACVVLLAGTAAWLLVGDSPPAAGQVPPAEPGKPAPRVRDLPPLAPPRVEAPAVAIATPPAPDAGPSPEAAAGPERKAPRGLPTRFTEPVIQAAVATALKEADSRGSSVVNVDCTEHPCIVYVENVSPYDTKDILKAPSLAAYKGESGFTACFPTVKSEGTGAGVCGFAYEPKLGATEHEAALKRFRYRIEQMRDATR